MYYQRLSVKFPKLGYKLARMSADSIRKFKLTHLPACSRRLSDQFLLLSSLSNVGQPFEIGSHPVVKIRE